MQLIIQIFPRRERWCGAECSGVNVDYEEAGHHRPFKDSINVAF